MRLGVASLSLIASVISVTSLPILHASPAPAPPLAEKNARAHDQAARKAYAAGAYRRAISEWKAGYALYPSADFLFNMAQAYRQLHEYDDAIALFTQFLREKPSAPDAADVRAQVAEMQRTLAAQRVPPPPPPPLPTPTPTTEPVPQPPPPQQPQPQAPPSATTDHDSGRGHGLKIAGLAVGITGLTALVAGAGLAIHARLTYDDLRSGAIAGRQWTQADADRESGMHTEASAAWICGAAGAATLAIGTVLYLVGAHREHVTIVPAVTSRSVQLGVVMEL